MIYWILGYTAGAGDCNIILNGKAIILIWIGTILIEANSKIAKIWWRIFINIILESHIYRPKSLDSNLKVKVITLLFPITF